VVVLRRLIACRFRALCAMSRLVKQSSFAEVRRREAEVALPCLGLDMREDPLIALRRASTLSMPMTRSK
jgi:hypothetical protein